MPKADIAATSGKAGESGAFPILRMGNITESGALDYSSLKYIDLVSGDVEKYTVRAGDILFNRTNSPALVGKTAVYRGAEGHAFAGYLVRLRTNDKAVPEYIGTYLNSQVGKRTLRGMCKAHHRDGEHQRKRTPDNPHSPASD